MVLATWRWSCLLKRQLIHPQPCLDDPPRGKCLGLGLFYNGGGVPSTFCVLGIKIFFDNICFTAGFYGEQRSTHTKLPVKTDQDTIREGYRYVHIVTLFSCASIYIYI